MSSSERGLFKSLSVKAQNPLGRDQAVLKIREEAFALYFVEGTLRCGVAKLNSDGERRILKKRFSPTSIASRVHFEIATAVRPAPNSLRPIWSTRSRLSRIGHSAL